jgi:MHS family alpha-ketoglutarate permease-like MFS transporter
MAEETKDSYSKHRLRSIVGGSIGNLVEWYDWYAYAAFAIYFSPVFFPNQDRTAQLLNTAGIFAVGFFMRPVGGWLFGSLADKIGRKKAMTWSVLLMSFGSLMIALIPSYKSIGLAGSCASIAGPLASRPECRRRIRNIGNLFK